MSLKEITCKCPSCGDTFELVDAMEEKALEEVRVGLMALNDEELQKRIEAEKHKALEEGKEQARQELLENGKETQSALLEARSALAKQELEKVKAEGEIAQLKQQQQAVVELELAKQKNRLEADAANELTKVKLKNEQLQKDVENATKRAGQGSMQLQGEASEINIEDTFKRLFPTDEVEPVKKGKRGADCFLHVKKKGGRTVAKILVESKNTKNFSDEWFTKIKDDLVNGGAAIGIIVTSAWPAGTRNEEQKAHTINGVWVCAFHEYPVLVRALREGLFALDRASAGEEAREGKAQVMFDFLTSHEFAHNIEQIFEPIFRMREQLDKEKNVMQRTWKERETLIEGSIRGTDSLYMKIQGIAQVNLPTIKGMDALEDLTEL
jgi:hypothetical protein